jgi:hypothetical protein
MVVEISRVEVGWLRHCLKFGGALREVAHHAHGYGTEADENTADWLA